MQGLHPVNMAPTGLTLSVLLIAKQNHSTCSIERVKRKPTCFGLHLPMETQNVFYFKKKKEQYSVVYLCLETHIRVRNCIKKEKKHGSCMYTK